MELDGSTITGMKFVYGDIDFVWVYLLLSVVIYMLLYIKLWCSDDLSDNHVVVVVVFVVVVVVVVVNGRVVLHGWFISKLKLY
jgi:hypothetical protein